MVMPNDDVVVPQDDQIDADQQALDDMASGEPAAPEYVTMEQFTAMQGAHQQVLAQNQQLSNHISGLESRLDKQGNAIRAELQAQAEALERKNREALQEQMLEGMDPEQQTLWKEYFRLQNQQPVSSTPVVEQTPPAPQPQQTATAADWAQVQGVVRDMGADPNDPRIDYTVLVNANLSAEERRQKFFSNVGAVVASPAGAQAPPSQQAQQAPPPAPNPQRAAGPTGGVGYRNADDVMDAFVSGKIDEAQYRELAPKHGIPL